MWFLGLRVEIGFNFFERGSLRTRPNEVMKGVEVYEEHHRGASNILKCLDGWWLVPFERQRLEIRRTH